MRRLLAAFLLACLVLPAVAPGTASAADTLLRLRLDGRPLDSKTPSGILHGGVAYVNVVRITKGFSGLLTFGKSDKSVNVTILGHTAKFWIGRRTGVVNAEDTTYPGAPFEHDGDFYVPLATIAQLAGAALTVDVKHGIARLTTQS